MTARCIFCREERDDYSTREHFIPERFGHGHPFVLEATDRAVCDGCQAWGSRHADPALVQQLEGVAGYLSMFCIPGKTGRPSNIRTPSGLAFEPLNGRIRMQPDPRTDASVARDVVMLSRGIHKMALGSVAWCEGVERAREPDLDEVARFVRGKVAAPFRAWARAHGRWVDAEFGMAIRLETEGVGLRVAIQLYSVTLWVDLVGPAERWLLDLGQEVPGLLAEWSPGGQAEPLSPATMLTIAPAANGSLQVAVKPGPDFVDGMITLDSMRRVAMSSPIQILDTSGPAWRVPGDRAGHRS